MEVLHEVAPAGLQIAQVWRAVADLLQPHPQLSASLHSLTCLGCLQLCSVAGTRLLQAKSCAAGAQLPAQQVCHQQVWWPATQLSCSLSEDLLAVSKRAASQEGCACLEIIECEGHASSVHEGHHVQHSLVGGLGPLYARLAESSNKQHARMLCAAA